VNEINLVLKIGFFAKKFATCDGNGAKISAICTKNDGCCNVFQGTICSIFSSLMAKIIFKLID
jgi:hypothetical protein